MTKGMLLVWGIVLLLAGVVFIGFGIAGNVISVEATVTATDSYTSIDVSNTLIDFGNVKRGEVSAYKVITVNNTGTENLLVTLGFANYTGTIFDYIYVRKSPGNDADYLPIGQFNFSLSRGDDQDLRFRLDLTNYTLPVYQTRRLTANIIVNAMPSGWAFG